ncbi:MULTISPECIES: hypothetical protein [unclassified Streptomyces]|uniref:hypothetical protein n=1 Tax=unclassified Streptomyces TaxID=2593676 RepID=UPI00226F3F31|nr:MULTISPECIES: hypothetical protein [unclassified Streptomyces]MCY0921862.1 hypothetical protein [Streptomyces sp. H27-G5]MCY0957188.1 hypothetical protein [Streptomyces sp. H27-H5]
MFVITTRRRLTETARALRLCTEERDTLADQLREAQATAAYFKRQLARSEEQRASLRRVLRRRLPDQQPPTDTP